MRTLVNAPLEAEDLLNIKDELVSGLNNITRNFSSSDDVGELFSIITGKAIKEIMLSIYAIISTSRSVCPFLQIEKCVPLICFQVHLGYDISFVT